MYACCNDGNISVVTHLGLFVSQHGLRLVCFQYQTYKTCEKWTVIWKAIQHQDLTLLMLELALWDRGSLLLVEWLMLANTMTKLLTGKSFTSFHTHVYVYICRKLSYGSNFVI